MSKGSVVVIGTGPAGATAAHFLQQAGQQVLLLEAGPRHGSLGLTLRVNGLTLAKLQRPLPKRVVSSPSVLVYENIAPGGLSNQWSCAVPRFSREDFEDARRAGEAYEWPLGYDDLAPWYDRVEPLLHIAGGIEEHAQLPAGRVHTVRRLDPAWQAAAGAAREHGRTLAPMPYAYGADTTLTLTGTAFNSFVRLVQPLLRRGNARIRYEAEVHSLEWSASERRVVAVRLRNPRTGAEERVECRAVVVAGGAVNSAVLLLQSKSADFPKGLGNTHDVLGRYLHDHPLGKLMFDLSRPLSMSPPTYLTRVELQRSAPLYAAACMQWSGAGNFLRSVASRHPGELPWVGYSVFGTMVPSADDWVRLDEQRRGPDGRALLELQVRHTTEARAALDRARDDVERLLTSMGFAPRQRVWHVEPPGESKHFGGTCRMHASPRYGVLDASSRVRDVPNVMVADSAAFTTGPEKNPVLTAMALAARGADRLAEELKRGTL